MSPLSVRECRGLFIMSRSAVWLQKGFGLVNAFIDHLYTRLVSTRNYCATANLHKSSQHPLRHFQPAIPCQRVLTVDILQLHALKSSLHRLPYRTKSVRVKLMLRPTVRSASPSWNKARIWGLRTDLYYCQTVAGLLMWGALSNERTGLSFARLSQQ
jgi:hypothetical protein